jgi:diacylglycerol kinase (ATP)
MSRLRALVVLNPVARSGRGRMRFALVQPTIDEVFEATVVETDGDGRCDAPIAAALRDGVRVIIAAGGDGTVNAVVDAIVRVRGAIPLDAIALGAVGLGSRTTRTSRSGQWSAASRSG